MNLGDNIIQLRKIYNISQEELADRLNVSRQTIYKWEASLAVPRADHIMKLVEVFGITYNDLFSGNLDYAKLEKNKKKD